MAKNKCKPGMLYVMGIYEQKIEQKKLQNLCTNLNVVKASADGRLHSRMSQSKLDHIERYILVCFFRSYLVIGSSMRYHWSIVSKFKF